MRTILGLMLLVMAVAVMGCSEPTPPVTDAKTTTDSVETASCDCCKDCEKCDDGEKCECTAKDGADCDCKCKDGAAEGETVSTEGDEEAAKTEEGSDHKDHE